MYDYRRWSCLTVFALGPGLMLMGILGLGGCASSESSQSAQSSHDQSTESAQTRSIPFRDQQSGIDSRGMKFFTLKHITSLSQFKKLNLDDVNPPPNFKNADMILLGLGEQPTGGYWVQITGLRMKGDTLTVQATANRPGEDASVSQSITQPYSIVTTPKIQPTQITSDINSVTGQPPEQPTAASKESQPSSTVEDK